MRRSPTSRTESSASRRPAFHTATPMIETDTGAIATAVMGGFVIQPAATGTAMAAAPATTASTTRSSMSVKPRVGGRACTGR